METSCDSLRFVFSNNCVSTLPIRNGNVLIIKLGFDIFKICKYLTYKEWKPFTSCTLVLSATNRVSTLPIRNGNFIKILRVNHYRY